MPDADAGCCGAGSSDHAQCMLLAVESVAVHALRLQRPDHALDQAVLLWAMRRDEPLVQAVAAHL